jgi:hypothetical protein
LVRNRDRIKETQDKAKEERASDTGGLPPDLNAFYGTYRITDPEKKIEALEKFISDFTNSSQIGSAKREILKATIKKWPTDKKRILDAANRMIKPGAGEAIAANVPEYQFIAKELFAAEILFDEAEEFALKSLKDFNKDRFIEGTRKMYAEWKRPMPSDEVMHEKYLKERAAYRTTLGRIYLKQGRMSEGEKILKDAYDTDPLLSTAAMGLAEIAEKRGDNATALDYLTTATLTAARNPYAAPAPGTDARSRFEALYRKTNNGSSDGLEELLDIRYRKLFPNPIQVDQYKPTVSRSNRVVLAEFFTGAG